MIYDLPYISFSFTMVFVLLVSVLFSTWTDQCGDGGATGQQQIPLHCGGQQLHWIREQSTQLLIQNYFNMYVSDQGHMCWHVSMVMEQCHVSMYMSMVVHDVCVVSTVCLSSSI